MGAYNESSKATTQALGEDECVELLLVDDEADFRDSAADYFRRRGHQVTAVASGRAALDAISKRLYDVAVIDVHMPEMDGVQLLTRLREQGEDLHVLMLTGGATVSTAVASMKAGAADYVSKPIRMADLEDLIRKAATATHLERDNARLRVALNRTAPKSEILGSSPQIEEVRRLIDRVAGSDKPVLIEGESGTGKELVARAVHAGSPMGDRPLVVINCAALPEHLLESELFGHEKGAFTGASQSKTGLFEVADRGALFIDEFGELAPSLQAKLLRVIEDGVIRRVGSVKERRVKVRLIAATNRDLEHEIAEGTFREDLYYRINVLKIWIPPLRERRGDIKQLAEHFAPAPWQFGDGVLEALQRYDWPGNIRQLSNALERGKLLSGDEHIIELENLPREVLRCTVAGDHHSDTVTSDAVDLESINRRHVEETLAKVKGNKAEAARLLGIHRRSLYRLLEKYAHR